MEGRVSVVTGASSGIGRETALGLARRGATVALVCRDPARGAATRDAIQAETRNPAVALFLADLASFAEIRGLADALRARYPRIHVLVNNAGVVNLRHSLTADGVETVFAVNHLAYFLLTTLLLDRLVESAPARIVNVASDAHRFGRMNWDDLGWERGYKAMRVYGQSKLANLLFTYELARRLEGSGVTVNAVHPGAVATGLGKNNGAFARALVRLLAPFFRTPAAGAATSLHLATSPEVEGVTGRYFASCREAHSSRASHDEEAAVRLWELSARLTDLPARVASAPADR
jgi:NAD(P)-dependent dehydrogenase (short-subunit alcohol dehydrogenase family)